MTLRIIKSLGRRPICDAVAFLKANPWQKDSNDGLSGASTASCEGETWTDVKDNPDMQRIARCYSVCAVPLSGHPEKSYELILRGALDRGCRSVMILPEAGPDTKTVDQVIRSYKKVLESADIDVVLLVTDRKMIHIPERFSEGLARSIACLKRKSWRQVKASADGSMSVLGAARALTCEDCCSTVPPEMPCFADAADEPGLDGIIAARGESFNRRLFSLIDERGLSDTEVYKRANLDRRLFSKIRCRADYKPKKKTVLALGIALRLDKEEMDDLLSRAELAMSPDSVSDLIVSYFIDRGVWDIYAINSALYRYNQPLLGA